MKNLAAIVSLLALLATPQFLAGAPDTVFLEDLTWPELRALIETGRVTTIILPIGGTEQSGPHMALGKHNVWSSRRQRRSRWAWNRKDSNGAQRSFEAASAAAADP